MKYKFKLPIILFSIFFLFLVYMFFEQYRMKNEILFYHEKLMKLESSYSEAYLKYNSILPNEVEEYIKKKDSVIVYFGRPNCTDCNFFEYSLEKIVDKYDLANKIVYVNVSSIHDNEEKWKAYKRYFGIYGTPSFVYYRNGICNSILDFEKENGITTKEFTRWLEKNKLIKLH